MRLQAERDIYIAFLPVCLSACLSSQSWQLALYQKVVQVIKTFTPYG